MWPGEIMQYERKTSKEKRNGHLLLEHGGVKEEWREKESIVDRVKRG